MILSLILLITAQTCAGTCTGGSCTGSSIDVDQPTLSVAGIGKATLTVKAEEYKIILYADSYGDEMDEAKEDAEDMRKEIIKVTKKIGGKEDDVVLTNVNTLEPIEEDPYFRVEQDIQIWLKSVDDINKTKEKYLMIDGVQIGSITPVISEATDYEPAIKKARKDAVKNAKNEAKALAAEMDVLLGEPLFISENIEYPTYSGYETSDDAEITVTVTVYYKMVYKK